MSQIPARPGTVRWISVGTFLTFSLLFALTYGYIPWLQYNWAFNLLGYPPELIAWSITALALLTTTEEARRGLIRAAEALQASVSGWSRGRLDILVLAAMFTLLLLCRERVMLGESRFLYLLVSGDPAWTYPGSGGLFVLRAVDEIAPILGLPGLPTAQLLHCGAGALAVVFVLHAARQAIPEGRSAGAVPLLVFSGGLFAAIAGRYEIQPLALCASAGYLALALRFLHGRGGMAAPALAFGLAAWLQPLCLFAAPGLLYLPRLAGRRFTAAVGLSLVPLLLHTAQLLAFAEKDVSTPSLLASVWIGNQGWVRGWGSGPSVVTDYVLLSAPHLKYLANAGFLLAPAMLPIAVAILGLRRRAALVPPAVRFVATTTAGLLLGSLALRPAWGPFDWDLFAVTGLWIGFLGAILLARIEAREVRTHVAAAAVGLQICFVGLPMTLIGQGAAIDRGLFDGKDFDPLLLRSDRPAPKHIAPWL